MKETQNKDFFFKRSLIKLIKKLSDRTDIYIIAIYQIIVFLTLIIKLIIISEGFLKDHVTLKTGLMAYEALWSQEYMTL